MPGMTYLQHFLTIFWQQRDIIAKHFISTDTQKSYLKVLYVWNVFEKLIKNFGNMYNNVTVEIVEQPASNQMRFRYVCEGRSAGSTLGVNSTEEEKTYPAIRVLNYDGTAVVIVSCVEVGPHPYRWVIIK